ncbi:8677_t:CDS:2 [Paraglomus brasilianum]|uniref:8677_t:CDS:1 n=1 Tax=Paraglomus brasilianum TaxID=144538 RepID=A0A9N9FL58_9GLOM|nr:8677_t:CDS:2 [Paraglomus brasilianum]
MATNGEYTSQASVASMSTHRRLASGSPTVISGVLSTAATAVTTKSVAPPEQANIDFKPVTTAVVKNPKLKIHVLLDSTIYTAGGNVYGRLVLTSSTSKSIKIGEISAELTAYEELSTREFMASQSFLSSRLVFQGATLPPSNAVHGPKENGFWTAKKGKTTFPFAFKIPADAPSSISFQSVASLKYVITGVVQIMYNGKEDTLFKSKEAFIVEACDIDNPIYKEPVEAMNMRQLWLGGSGALMVEGTLVERLFMSGGNVSVKVRVKNDTKRSVQGLKLAVKQKLAILANKNKKEADDVKVVSATVAEEWFKNKDYLFESGEDRTITVNIYVPATARTISHTVLFEVTCHIVVSLYLGPFTKYLTIELPAYICHSASVQPPPVANLELNQYNNHYNMIDENADFFVEDLRQDDADVLGGETQPVNIPNGRKLPWNNDEAQGQYSPTYNSGKSSIFGSASPKKIGSFTSTLLGRPKPKSPPNPSKLIPKGPALAPASPYAYIPAIERVRYLSFATQQQAALQTRRPLPTPPHVPGFGIYTANEATSPPLSEYEWVSSAPATKIEEWLETQQTGYYPYGSRPVSPEIESTTPPRETTPWSNLNRIQAAINSEIESESLGAGVGEIPIEANRNYHLPADSFQRSETPVSSLKGPSGLTLLMKSQNSPPPAIPEEFISRTETPITNNDNKVTKGRPLPPTPPAKPPLPSKPAAKPLANPVESPRVASPIFRNSPENDQFKVARKPVTDNKFLTELIAEFKADGRTVLEDVNSDNSDSNRSDISRVKSPNDNPSSSAAAEVESPNYSKPVTPIKIPVGVNTSPSSSLPGSQSPIDPSKITAAATTYVNTTIAKPVVVKSKPLSSRKKNNDADDNEEASLTAKITEPPKQALSPRLQEYIQKYIVAAGR